MGGINTPFVYVSGAVIYLKRNLELFDNKKKLIYRARGSHDFYIQNVINKK